MFERWKVSLNAKDRACASMAVFEMYVGYIEVCQFDFLHSISTNDRSHQVSRFKLESEKVRYYL